MPARPTPAPPYPVTIAWVGPSSGENSSVQVGMSLTCVSSVTSAISPLANSAPPSATAAPRDYTRPDWRYRSRARHWCGSRCRARFHKRPRPWRSRYGDAKAAIGRTKAEAQRDAVGLAVSLGDAAVGAAADAGFAAVIRGGIVVEAMRGGDHRAGLMSVPEQRLRPAVASPFESARSAARPRLCLHRARWANWPKAPCGRAARPLGHIMVGDDVLVRVRAIP